MRRILLSCPRLPLSSLSLQAGQITLPSSIIQFWDLGGQRGIRSIWHRYYDDCHAVVYVIDADDRERLSEGWEVFGKSVLCVLWLGVVTYTDEPLT